MKFRTEITIKPSGLNINSSTRIIMLGSCFAQNIAHKLLDAGFIAASNPIGILFNPLSICAALNNLTTGRVYRESDLRYDKHLNRWFCYDFHGSLSDADPELALAKMNKAISGGREALVAAETVIITLGTAWIFELKESGAVVANCHRQLASEFVRRRVDVNEIVDNFTELLKTVLKGKQAIFTISPVRHLADGFEDNFISKATLRVAIERLEREFDNVHYFPAYEILNDDLRDYCFYADDLVHPSPAAIEYVWERFKEWMS